MSAALLIVHRSCLQMCHEVARSRQRLLATMRAADVAPQVNYDTFQRNLTMVLGVARTVTRCFCDDLASIVQKLIAVPGIPSVLLEADSLQGLTVGGNVV